MVQGVNLSFHCAMSVTPFYSAKPGPTYAPHPETSNLVPTLELPVSVKAGSVLSYQVDIYNPMSTPAKLEPCPFYLEYSSIPTKLFYRLNCSTARSIGAHSTVRYQMKMQIPSDAPLGMARIYWVFDGPGNVARGKVQITG